MTSNTPPPQAQERERTQKRSDILESNLFNAISKQENPFAMQFQINRETSPDPVIIKALSQLFPRLNIKAPKILLLLRKLLLKKLPEGEELKIRKQILNLAETGNPEIAHLGITLRAFVTAERLAVEIKGVPPLPPKDSGIEQAFFDHESCPGAFKKDGSIDFKEINKYPIVKAGDNLFYITPEVQGRSGIQYDGKVIPVSEAKPLVIQLNGGVDIVDSLGEDGKSRGYFIRAGKTGAVLLTRTGDKISAIEIRDALDVKRLDYSTGNIGTNFICPISMKIDTICNDFRIRARGMVEVGELDGGHIETESHAKVHTSHPGSSIQADEEITIHLSRNSTISSKKGFVTIIDEAVDSRFDAVGITFEKYKGILSGNTLDAEQITLDKVYFSGENNLHFGGRLFKEREELIQKRRELKEEALAQKEKEAELLDSLHDNLKALSKILKNNPLLKGNLRTLILATQKMEYPVLYRELDIIGQTMNTKEVEQIKKHLDTLRLIPELEQKLEIRDKAMAQRIEGTEKEMSQMRLSIEGLLRRAATLKIFTPVKSKENPDRPQLFIESKQEKDTLIKIQGRYNRSQGFVITQE